VKEMAKKRILVPSAREKLDQLQVKLINEKMGIHAANKEQAKEQIANEIGVELGPEVRSVDAGKVGGKMGGALVKELVQMALENLAKKRS
jgi:small acid-soluble spore protein D (minor alpha/beta-type SASP)